MEVGIGTVNLYRFIPDYRLHAEFRFPMKFYEGRFTAGVDQPEGMYSESFHKTKRPGNRTIGHDPHGHVNTFWGQGNEIPEIIGRGLSLGKAAVGLLLRRVDQIWKLDRVLDKKHRDVIADNVPIALLCIKLNGKASHVTGEVSRSFIAGHRRESYECGSFLPGPLKDIGSCNARLRFVILEIAMRPETTSMHYALRNAFMIKMKDFLTKMEILQQSRTASADSQ